MNNLKESLDELQKALEANQHTLGQPLLSKGAPELATKYLTSKAQDRLSTKGYQQVIVIDDKTYIAAYLCAQVRTANVETGIKAIADVINELADKQLIYNCLAPLSYIELAQIPMHHDSSVAYCFPMVPADRLDDVKAIAGNLFCSEGSIIGPQLDSLYKELPEGQFYAEANLSISAQLIQSKALQTKEDRLQDIIQEYLNVLPKGTQLVSSKPCAIMSLDLPFEVIFSNPLLKSIKSVKLEHMHMAEMVDDRVEQFNLFLGLTYVKRNGETIGPAVL